MKDVKKNYIANEFLENAYTLKTPKDNINYYKEFSKIYDDTFVKSLDYIYPKSVALEFYNHYVSEGEICDIGCGTGLVGQELYSLNSNFIIDGFDISSDMISFAKTKNIYRDFYNVDLTKPIKNITNNYSGLISVGTFTHGHLGPNSIANLLSIVKKGALLTIGINALHYRKKGFEAALHKLEANSRIKIIKISSKSIYGLVDKFKSKENQLGMVCTFTKVTN